MTKIWGLVMVVGVGCGSAGAPGGSSQAATAGGVDCVTPAGDFTGCTGVAESYVVGWTDPNGNVEDCWALQTETGRTCATGLACHVIDASGVRSEGICR
jgi:hypothetical protein